MDMMTPKAALALCANLNLMERDGYVYFRESLNDAASTLLRLAESWAPVIAAAEAWFEEAEGLRDDASPSEALWSAIAAMRKGKP